jgi:hypothetical protein
MPRSVPQATTFDPEQGLATCGRLIVTPLRPVDEYSGRMRTIVAALALLIAVSSLAPALAQPTGAPTDCTEAMFGASTFIGHDCGEWASVVIAGNIIIRKPWSWANRASRAVRIRESRQGGGAAVVEPTKAPKRTPTPTECHPDYVECLPIVDDLNCGDPPIGDGIVHLRNPRNDAYRLDVSNGVGNGIGCDDES